jgi:hypothetical protein
MPRPSRVGGGPHHPGSAAQLSLSIGCSDKLFSQWGQGLRLDVANPPQVSNRRESGIAFTRAKVQHRQHPEANQIIESAQSDSGLQRSKTAINPVYSPKHLLIAAIRPPTWTRNRGRSRYVSTCPIRPTDFYPLRILISSYMSRNRADRDVNIGHDRSALGTAMVSVSRKS